MTRSITFNYLLIMTKNQQGYEIKEYLDFNGFAIILEVLGTEITVGFANLC